MRAPLREKRLDSVNRSTLGGLRRPVVSECDHSSFDGV